MPTGETNPVVLDANALLMPFQFKLNMDAELKRLLGGYTVYVPESVLRELEKGRDWKNRAAVRLASKYERVPSEAGGDDAVIEAALRLSAYVVTNDRGLKERLREVGVTVIALRSRNHLVIEEH